MAEMTYLQAISDGLRGEMRRDKRVFVIGEDVGVYGGAFKVTLGFQEEFGAWRVIDSPLSETAIVAGCTGAAIMGMRPVAEMQFADFISCAWDHLVTVAAKQRWRAGTPVPITVRLPSGGGFSGGPCHSQNRESAFAHIPGLKCVRAKYVQGARAPRGHAERRLRRGDRCDDRGGGVRGPRRAGEADCGARHTRPVLAAAREGVHPTGRGRRRRIAGARGLLMATTSVVDVVMPQMGVSVSEGTITKWLKEVGDAVEADENLLEISTDKVDTEVPSPGTGVVQEILVQEGETVDVGTKLATIAPEGAEVAAPAEEPA